MHGVSVFAAAVALFGGLPIFAGGEVPASEPIIIHPLENEDGIDLLDQYAVEQGLLFGGVEWEDESAEIVLGSWNSIGEPWASVGDLEIAIGQLNSCLREHIPYSAGAFELQIISSGVLPDDYLEELATIEKDCAESAGVLLPQFFDPETDKIAVSDDAGFAVIAVVDLSDGGCLPVVQDGSHSYCPLILVGDESIPIIFDSPLERVIAEVPNLFSLTAGQVGSAVIGGTVLVLLVGLPAQLVGSSLENAWASMMKSRLALRFQQMQQKRLPSSVSFILTAVAAALITSVVELRDVTTLSEWLTGSALWLVGFGLVSLGGLLVTTISLGRARSGAELEVHPSSLAIVALTVIVSWATGFDPPVIFGLVFGLTFGIRMTKRLEGQTALIGAGYTLTVGLLGWLVYSALSQQGGGDGFVGQLASAVAISTISALPISLLPIRLLDGRKILEWNRPVALVGFFVSTSFFVLLASRPGEPIWQQVDNLALWVLIYCGFVAASVGIWWWLRRLSLASTREE